MFDKALSILRNVFGYSSFRPFQEEIIKNILGRKDTIVIMATGGGKSLCYQIPAQIFEGLTIVVSPLISLMKDQVEQLRELGVSALFLNSSLSAEEYFFNINLVRRNGVKLLYLAPETLLLQKTIELLSSVRVDAIAIDEAHCISEWGHDFRPEYRKIAEVRKFFSDAVCIALTATATPKVILDIGKNLEIGSPRTFIASFNRKNLFLQVAEKNNPLKQAIDFIRRFPNKSGIVYCLSRKQVESLTEDLVRNGFSAKPYHAGLSDLDRHMNQESFIRDDVQIIVATVAFGMGINKPNIRFVLHYDLPQNIEGYYQQIGRAGRDGLNAQCLLLFSYGDIHKLKYFINQKEGDELKAARQNLRAMVSYAESFECRRIPLLKYFGEKCDTRKCGMCDNCLSGSSESVDLTVPAQKFLSCVKRTGEKYGSEYIIDVLRGSEARKIIENGHNSLSTYNIGREYSKKQWLYLARQLLQKELMEQDMETGSLKITERTWDVFRGKEYVFGRMIDARGDSVDEREKIQREIQAKAETEVEDQNYDIRLFDLLKKKRKELADMNAIPPYAVFPDRTLIEMSVFYPGTRDEMMMLHGVGLVKYEKYGEVFIDTISPYCRENNIENRPVNKPEGNIGNGLLNKEVRNNVIRNSVNINTERKSARPPRKRDLYAGDYNSGISLKEIIRKYDTDIRHVAEHLTKYIIDGETLRESDEFLDYSELSDEQIDLVMNAFTEIGHERLRPVYEALGEKISFDELKLMRLHYIVTEGQST